MALISPVASALFMYSVNATFALLVEVLSPSVLNNPLAKAVSVSLNIVLAGEISVVTASDICPIYPEEISLIFCSVLAALPPPKA